MEYKNDISSEVYTWCTEPYVTNEPLVDLDGNVYTTVRIGEQEWTIENWRCTKYPDGSAIPNLTTDEDWFNGINGNKHTYGALYNWYAATYNVGGASIAPAGWHLPTKTEFETLVTFLGGSTVAGGKLKESGTTHWASPNIGADNSSGFTARGSGNRRDYDALFLTQLQASYIWSSTSLFALSATILFLSSNLASSSITSMDKNYGFSIRLIKDDDVDPGTMTDIEGTVYNTVKIGNQVWMAENLNVSYYNDNTAIPVLTDAVAWAADTSGAMCFYNNTLYSLTDSYCWYNNDIANKSAYGTMNNWYAVNKELIYLSRGGVQEPGWHTPTVAEWLTLVNYCGGEAFAGGPLKEEGLTHWQTPNTGAIDQFGFKAVPGGWRRWDGEFLSITEFGSYWCNTEYDSDFAYYITFSYGYAGIQMDWTGKGYGFSVRAVR